MRVLKEQAMDCSQENTYTVCQKNTFSELARHKLKHQWRHCLMFFKWLILGSALGVVIGGAAVLFHYSIDFATSARASNDWLLLLLPVAGVLIVLLYKWSGMEDDKGTNMVLRAVRSTDQVSIKTAPLIVIATFLTHLCGGSAGREGAALQMGGSIGDQVGRWLHMDIKDMHIITMCGMSAAFSALFGTPVAAAIFSMEVVSVGVMYYAAIIPCITASLVGYGLAGICGVKPVRFLLTNIPQEGILDYGRVILLAALCALVSILFCSAIHLASKAYIRLFPQPVIRAFAGGCLVLALTLIIGSRAYNGAGMDVISRAMNGEARPEAFLLKILLTAATLGAGYRGGEIIPTFFVGSTFGCFMGGLLGLNPAFGAGIGVVSLFCGVTNCPITSLLIALELFGADGLLYYALAAATSYMLSGYYGLYSEQKILYSKVRPVFIDKKAE